MKRVVDVAAGDDEDHRSGRLAELRQRGQARGGGAFGADAASLEIAHGLGHRAFRDEKHSVDGVVQQLHGFRDRDADRETVLQTLNAHSREVLVEGDRLRIGFGALKNAAAQTAVLALMEQLLTREGRPAAPPRME